MSIGQPIASRAFPKRPSPESVHLSVRSDRSGPCKVACPEDAQSPLTMKRGEWNDEQDREQLLGPCNLWVVRGLCAAAGAAAVHAGAAAAGLSRRDALCPRGRVPDAGRE